MDPRWPPYQSALVTENPKCHQYGCQFRKSGYISSSRRCRTIIQDVGGKQAIHDISKYIHVYLFLNFKIVAKMAAKMATDIRKMTICVVLEGLGQ